MIRRLAMPARRIALDWFAPIVIFVIGVVNVSRHPHSTSYPGSPGQHVLFLGVAVALLGVRRRAPLLAPLAAMGVVTWWSSVMWSADQQGPFEGFLVLVGAAYSLGALNTGRRLAAGAAALAASFLIGQVLVLAGGGRDGDLLPVVVWQCVAFGAGYLISRRTEQAHEAREAAAVIAADQERQTARAIEDERARIARELHDIVAHGLSVIVVQAGAERRALHNGPADGAALDAALGSIERSGREALVDLRRLLGLLRRTDEPAALAPQPGLAQLDELVQPVRDAGIDVAVEISGERRPLPSGLDLSAYRIVQEALTNVLKHANARRVHVGLTFNRAHLDLEVADDGDASSSQLATVGAGHGLIGMRERVAVFGGSVTAGPRPSGGWCVHSRLPVTPVAAE